MPNDITNPSSHLYWLWLAYGAVVTSGVIAYNTMRNRNECLSERIGANELKLQVQLTEIKTQLTQMNINLYELKTDFRTRP